MYGLLDYLEQISFFFIAEKETFGKKLELCNQKNVEYINFMYQQDFSAGNYMKWT